MELRPAREDDAETIANVFARARAGMTYLTPPSLDGGVSLGRALMAEREVWVAEDRGRVVGFAALCADALDHLYVDPPAQRRGIGSQLLACAQERRPGGFGFWVFQRNILARRFYERNGCRLVKLTDGRGNDEREPDAFYEWRPSPRKPTPTADNRAEIGTSARGFGG